ncbi:MAG: translation initiation factor IF-2 [Candidatus Wallbacteria bacterium]|nr:translation initiation factor IF-2 [Candidatus Wallbacteria bacterium]
MKKRIYDLAKELELSSKDIVDFLKTKGHVKVASSTIEDELINLVTARYRKAPLKAVKPEVHKKAEPAKKEDHKKPEPAKKPEAVKKESPKEELPKKTEPLKPEVQKRPELPKADLHKKIEPIKKVEPPKVEEAKKIEPQKLEPHKPEPPKIEEKSGKTEAVPVLKKEEPAPAAEKTVQVKLPFEISFNDLCKKLNFSRAELVKKLMSYGITNINLPIDYETSSIIAEEAGFIPEQDKPAEVAVEVFDPRDLEFRSPIVTIMGHVDHGKTTLLDYIRKTHVAEHEAGGITQHIGAYKVILDKHKKKTITFIDTPGHEAFTAMRAHGAKVTDIAILVVAADDGVKPQTIEALDHAKAAKLPIIVAVNKIDKPDANPDKVKQELSNYGIMPEEWGGKTIFVNISAKTGLNVKELLEMIVLQSEVLELKANYKIPARGFVIESKLDRGLGPIATVLVQHGKLKVGQTVLIGSHYGKIRTMRNENMETLKEADPADPVEISGISGVPQAGETFKVVETEKLAKDFLKQKDDIYKTMSRSTTLEEIFQQIKDGENKTLRLIVKSDVHGSSVAIGDSLAKLGNSEVKVDVVHRGVGAITETDVMLATASAAIIIGFNVRPMSNALKLAEKNKIEIRTYKVIYDIIEDIKKALTGLLTPEKKEKVTGHAEIRAVFKISKIGTIGGCYLTDGKIVRTAQVRLLRDGAIIYTGKLSSLKRFKDDAREVLQGFECGIGIENYNDLKVGDVIESFIIEEIEKTLESGDNLE